MSQVPAREEALASALPRALGIGLVAGFGATLVLLALRFALNTESLLELLSEVFLDLIPSRVFSTLLGVLETQAKPLLFLGLLLAQSLLLAGIAIVFLLAVRRYPNRAAPPWDAYFLSLLLWLIAMLALTPAADGGFFGSDTSSGWVRYSAAHLLGLLAYGYVLNSLQERFLPAADAYELFSRRRSILRLATLAGLGLVSGGYVARLFTEGTLGMGNTGFHGPGLGTMPTEITPNDEFYIVSKNLVDPTVPAGDWKLEVRGDLVEEPYSLTYEELQSLPAVEEIVTLECISNEVGGLLISNARWKGVPLRYLLDRARLKEGVVDISFAAWDRYSESIPLELALQPHVLVAYEMNDEFLPHRHGHPARLLVPGQFGLKSVKWLTRIEPVAYNFQGFWQDRGWADRTPVKTTSQVRVPAPGDGVPEGSVSLGGVAFSGDRGISQVEVSVDDGPWRPAQIKRALSPYTWVLWSAEVTSLPEGRHELRVRATDGLGELQTKTSTPTAPSGATGYHRIPVTVPPSSSA